MKSYSAAYAHPAAKRRWTCFSVTVPVLVFLSLVGTGSVLLGLHNRFPSGSSNEESPTLANKFASNVNIEGGDENHDKGNEKRINELVDKFKSQICKRQSSST